jgi:uncharacterized spore protein YtfJ
MSEEQPARPVAQAIDAFFATFERAQNKAVVNSVYGEPIPYGNAIVIPVASVSQVFGVGLGVGAGPNADSSAGEGAGGGGTGRVTARPVAMAEITSDGVDVHPIIDENRALVASLLFAGWAVFWATRTLIKLFK